MLRRHGLLILSQDQVSSLLKNMQITWALTCAALPFKANFQMLWDTDIRLSMKEQGAGQSWLSGIGNTACPSRQGYLLRQSLILGYSRTEWLQSTASIFSLGFYFSVYSSTRFAGGWRKVLLPFRTILQKSAAMDLNQVLLTLQMAITLQWSLSKCAVFHSKSATDFF